MSRNRILLVMGQQGNRRLLSEMLSRTYEVVVARDERDLTGQFDLAILDRTAFNALYRQVRQRKQAEEPVFLPFLLVTQRQDTASLSRNLWQTVDELVLTPVDRVEFEGRVARLLTTRRDSLDQQQRNQELEALIAELSDAFESATNEDQLADILLTRVLIAVHGETGAVLLADVDQCRLVAAQGEDLARLFDEVDAAPNIPSLVAAIQEGSPAIQDRLGVAELEGSNRPTLIAPMVIRNESVGVLIVQRGEGSHFGQSDLQVVESLCSQASVFLNNLRQAYRLVEAAQYQEQLELAEHMQQQLLPAEDLNVAGLDIASAYMASNKIGGDYYDVFNIAPNLVGAVIADVSGHSIPSGLIMNAARSAVRLLVRQQQQPEEVLRQLNETLYWDLDQTNLFISIILVIIDLEARVARYSSAGHNPGFLHQVTVDNIVSLDSTGLLVGILPDTEFDVVEVPFGPGDTLVLYTDGITEARNVATEELFGEWRLKQVISEGGRTGARNMVNSILAAVRRHSRNQLDDDVTLLVLKVPSGK